MRSPLCAALALSLSLSAGACATLPVNSIANGRAPRVQAVVILAFAAAEAAISYESAKRAQSGEITCHMKPDAGEGFYELKNDCTGPIENALGAVMFGIPATIDVGVAVYQLITNKPAYTYKPRKRRQDVALPVTRDAVPASDSARVPHDGDAPVEVVPDFAPPSETEPAAPAVLYPDRAACLRDRSEQQRRALQISDLGERAQRLMALPDCSGFTTET